MAEAARSVSDEANRRDTDVSRRDPVLPVYGYMAAGLAASAAAAELAFELRLASRLLELPVLLGGTVASPVLLALVAGPRADRMKPRAAQFLFWLYSLLLGLSASTLFDAYVGEEIARTFLLAGMTFLAVAVHGYATRCHLTSLDAVIGMGAAAIVFASIAGIVLVSSPLQFAISLAGLVAIVGLTGRYAPRINRICAGVGPAGSGRAAAIRAALALYTGLIDLPSILSRRS